MVTMSLKFLSASFSKLCIVIAMSKCISAPGRSHFNPNHLVLIVKDEGSKIPVGTCKKLISNYKKGLNTMKTVMLFLSIVQKGVY